MIGVDLNAADIAYLRLSQLHLLLRARSMLLLGEMILTKTKSAIWTTAQSLFAALVAPTRGGHGTMNMFDFTCIVHRIPSFVYSDDPK
ncbi:hypothetical protein KSF_016420 [Reticulibacter mediterranei]|uniref:Uncharacterized protein n=1 Tax=Reticulibacter mediterranei TaxID=2778369 RepID=A0A8J3IHU6_9CHLR|nr:hypothetical protein KSF_016420 [Reticulibacter mediterranei]